MRRFLRVNSQQFEFLFSAVSHRILKQDTKLRSSIKPAEGFANQQISSSCLCKLLTKYSTAMGVLLMLESTLFFSSSVILEAVVSSVAILSSSKTSCAQKEQFDWPMPLNVVTQLAWKVLHCATWEKFLATLQDALRKVELTSTFHNDCGNKKIARFVWQGILH